MKLDDLRRKAREGKMDPTPPSKPLEPEVEKAVVENSVDLTLCQCGRKLKTGEEPAGCLGCGKMIGYESGFPY